MPKAKKKDKAAHKVRVEVKAAKKAGKKAKKEQQNADEDDEDIDAILARFKEEQETLYKITEEVVGGPPSRRANASFIANPINTSELLLFGGEFFDGQRVHMYNDFYRYNIDKDEWKRITSPNSPGPRSSQQMVVTPSGTLFLFGGEFVSPNETQFFHYKDFWSLDLKTNQWEKLETKARPTPRSGHRMILWKHLIVLFGGFHDNNNQTNYFDDLWVFDTTEYKWSKVELPSTAQRPSARSGFCFVATENGALLHGGYCKQQIKGERSKGVTLADTWLLKMNVDLAAIRWDKRKKSSNCPSGAAMAIHKNRAVMFGGVYDEDVNEESMESTFFEEMHTYIVDTGKWFALPLRTPKNADPNAAHLPRARYNAMLAVQKSNLYLYGGIIESGDKEFTLDDFWVVHLDKNGECECVTAGSGGETGWIAESDDEDEEDIDSDASSDGTDEINEVQIREPSASLVDEAGEAVSPTTSADVVMDDASMPQGSGDDGISPMVGESLRDFYARTTAYWAQKALDYNAASEQQESVVKSTGKLIRRTGFALAEAHYQACEPMLRQMEALQIAADVEYEIKEAASTPQNSSDIKSGSRYRR